MYLRHLNKEDASGVIKLMKDSSFVNEYQKDYYIKKYNEIIFNDQKYNDSFHYSILSDSDEFMGVISLSDINDKSAELFISVSNAAMGRGYAWFGMETLLDKAFKDLGLENVYWCVLRDNARAVRFFDKHNFHEVIDVPKNLEKKYNNCKLKWYSVLNGDEINIRESVAGCKVVHIKTIPTVGAGELSFFEGNHDINFSIKRIYYISKVPEGVRRGFHAHKKLKQLLFCPYGRIQLVLENNNGREEIELSDPSIGVIIEECTWREMLWLQKDSVLCVAASDYYNIDDYIRDYETFKNFINDK